MTAAPKRHADTLVEHSADGKFNDAPLEVSLREFIEPANGCEVLRKTGRLELRIAAPQIVAFEDCVGPHPSAQQPATKCSVAEGCDVVCAAVWENVRFDGSFEEVVGWL